MIDEGLATGETGEGKVDGRALTIDCLHPLALPFIEASICQGTHCGTDACVSSFSIFLIEGRIWTTCLWRVQLFVASNAGRLESMFLCFDE